MFDFFRRREEQRLLLKAVADALADAARAREAEALRIQALLEQMREERRQDQETFTRLMQSMAENTAKVVEGVTSAVAAQANAISEHLKLFKTDSAPVGRTVRDEDEYRQEVERLRELLPEEELAAMLQMEVGLLEDIDLN